MGISEVFQELGIQPERIFTEAFSKEYYGVHLFESTDQNYYLFSQGETGDAVCIIAESSQDPPYRVLLVEEVKKFHPHAVVPRLCTLNHCEFIIDTWFDDLRVRDIEKKIKQSGESLAKKANGAFMRVLMASVTNNKIMVHTKNGSLGKTLADIFSKLTKEGYRLDKFLFPEHLEGQFVQQGLIIRDGEVPDVHYVGKTITGQDAFWSNELSEDTALIFASSVGITLTQKLGVWVGSRSLGLHGPTPTICGHLGLNPIVKSVHGVIALEGLEQAFSLRTSPKVSAGMEEAQRFFEDIKKAITASTIEDDFKNVALYDLEQAQKAYRAEAYKACTIMLGAVLEGLMLGIIRREDTLNAIRSSKNLPPVILKLRPQVHTDSDLAKKFAKDCSFEDYKQIIRYLMPEVTALGAEDIQVFRNAVHPWKSVESPTIYVDPGRESAMKHLASLVTLANFILKWMP